MSADFFVFFWGPPMIAVYMQSRVFGGWLSGSNSMSSYSCKQILTITLLGKARVLTPERVNDLVKSLFRDTSTNKKSSQNKSRFTLSKITRVAFRYSSTWEWDLTIPSLTLTFL